jgi:hypothetical protein
MTTLREAVAQALDALTKIHPGNMSWETGDAWMNAVQILREALAQREPEPVADTESDVLTATYMLGVHAGKKAVTKRKPLTVEQLRDIKEHQRLLEELGPVWAPMLYYFCQAIERAHGIGEREE